jgi:hypothetical protein
MEINLGIATTNAVSGSHSATVPGLAFSLEHRQMPKGF